MTFRPLRAYREISASLHQLDEANAAAEQKERLALARSTSRFCQKSKQVVDDTMSLSAVLMRAGEVKEAQRLLAEVDRDVEQEKVALLDVMNEVEQKKAERSHKMTRLRMAKMLMSAVLGASLMMFSAFGVALANYFTDRVVASEGDVVAAAPVQVRDVDRMMRHVELAPGVKFRLTADQYETYARLSSAKGDPKKLESFLRDVLPPGLLDKVLLVAKDVTNTLEPTTTFVKATVKKAASTSSGQTSSSSSGTSNDGDGSSSSSGSGSNDKDAGDEETSEGGSSDEGCKEEPKEGGDGDSQLLGGSCIPIVNKESPV